MSRKKQNTKKKHKNTKTSKIKTLKIFLLIFLFAFLTTAFSYLIQTNEQDKTNNKTQNNILLKEKEVKKTETIKKVESKKVIETPKKEIVKKEIIQVKEIDEKILEEKFEEKTKEFKKDFIPKIEKVEKKEETKEKNIYLKKAQYTYNKKQKPKLAIVIDDVSNKRQKRNILSVNKKITMAFLPPTKGHKDSAKISQDSIYHIIHLPLQASKAFKSTEPNTLTIKHSYEEIEKRVKELRELYPNVVYTNNHTGSVFTQNEKSMDMLFKALKKYNFTFVDSRTTSKSKAQKMAEKYNTPYIVRNTFLDNKRDFRYVQGQLKRAIKLAKQRGYAIAIGHPYKVTIDVIKKSKRLLKDVELIYIQELPYL